MNLGDFGLRLETTKTQEGEDVSFCIHGLVSHNLSIKQVTFIFKTFLYLASTEGLSSGTIFKSCYLHSGDIYRKTFEEYMNSGRFSQVELYVERQIPADDPRLLVSQTYGNLGL